MCIWMSIYKFIYIYLYYFLETVVGSDSVDDESRPGTVIYICIYVCANSMYVYTYNFMHICVLMYVYMDVNMYLHCYLETFFGLYIVDDESRSGRYMCTDINTY
jgi:hypothetical protein